MLDVDRILKLVKEAGYNEDTLCKTLGWGGGTINRWRKNVPGVDKLFMLSNLLGHRVSYLLGETDVEKTTPSQNKSITIECSECHRKIQIALEIKLKDADVFVD